MNMTSPSPSPSDAAWDHVTTLLESLVEHVEDSMALLFSPSAPSEARRRHRQRNRTVCARLEALLVKLRGEGTATTPMTSSSSSSLHLRVARELHRRFQCDREQSERDRRERFEADHREELLRKYYSSCREEEADEDGPPHEQSQSRTFVHERASTLVGNVTISLDDSDADVVLDAREALNPPVPRPHPSYDHALRVASRSLELSFFPTPLVQKGVMREFTPQGKFGVSWGTSKRPISVLERPPTATTPSLSVQTRVTTPQMESPSPSSPPKSSNPNDISGISPLSPATQQNNNPIVFSDYVQRVREERKGKMGAAAVIGGGARVAGPRPSSSKLVRDLSLATLDHEDVTLVGVRTGRQLSWVNTSVARASGGAQKKERPRPASASRFM
eukprot:PhM_4_TR14613/c0_g1_i1/m.84392